MNVEPQKNDRQLRGVVIGAGYFSEFHLDAWNRIEQAEIVAVCDIDADKARSMADKHGVAQTSTDLHAMLQELTNAAAPGGPIDFVDIVTRPDTHLEIVTAATEHDLAIICQKPLAPTAEEASQIVDVATAANVPLMVHENFRFQPWYREVKQLLDAGAIGDRLHTISFRNRAGDGWGDDAYLARQPYFQTMEKFLIFEAGIHTIDTFRYLAGEINEVWCSTRKLNPVIAGEDTAIALFEFAGGGRGLYDANRFNESTAKNPRYTFGTLLVEGNGGSIRMDDEGRLTIQRLGEAVVDHAYQPATVGFAGDCVLTTQQHFVDRLLLGSNAFETDGDSYLKSIAVQEAMYRSAETGHWESPQ